jgi:beta-lactamase regulating signal transducer with metallopeptidase domain
MQKRRGDRMREIMISSTVMILLVMLFRVIFRGKVRHCLIYAMWLFVALRLLVPVNIGTFSFGVSGMMNQVQNHTENTKEIETDKMQEGSLNTLVLHKNTTTNSKMTVPEEKETPAQISAQEKLQEAWKAYKDKIWLAGTCSILLVVLAANIFYVHKLKKNRKSFDKFREGKLPVYVTENVQVPCLYGVFKTAIYLPAQRLDQLTEEQVKWIICHEECHYRQGDHIWSLLRILLTAVYWFHPLVWAAAYLSKKDAEISCDEKVLANSNMTQKIAYGKTLICVASRDRKLSVFYPTTAVVGTKKELKNRMRKIVEENKYKRKAKVVLAVIMVTSVVFTFSGCGNVTQKDAQNSSATSDKIEKLQTTKNDNSKAAEQEKDTIKDDTKWNEKFTDFLKENQKKYKLFSVVTVGEKREPVLLVSKKQYASDVLDGLSGKIRTDVTGTSEPMKIKTGADVYVLQGDEVKKIDSISCSSSGEWIHVNEGKVYVDTHHSLTGFEWNDGKWTSNEIAQKMDKDYENYDTEFAKQFFWNFEVADSVIFWNNTSKNRKKIETDSYGSDSVFRVRLVDGGVNFENQAGRGIVRDLKKTEQTVFVCDTSAIYKKENKPVIWFNCVNDKKEQRIWSASPSVWDQSKWEQYYTVEGKKKESTMLRLRPATFSGKGKAGYEWQQFYLTKDGKEHVTDEDSIIYDPDAVTQEDVDNMGAFIDHLWKNRLEKAECLISTYEYLDMYSGYGDIMHEKLLAEKEKMK